MKKAVMIVIALVFIFVTQIALADSGETKDSGTKSGPALNNFANWILSHFPKHESIAGKKDAVPPLSKEELKIRREHTGMGMRGRVGNE